ncbi:outer surface protein ErpG [Borreliella americana]|uniref:outer surface protein ErpG n=1 Tax=Borreliella americana TaxID=478807 RepID=UPI001E5341DC|nr:outer surface protein ErpG [Borreliella americana]MCD2332850.1 outer surface protein ErpG [Borreliella americana]
MNKKMFIAYTIFILVSSCKNHTNDKNLKSVKEHLENEAKGFLSTKTEIKEEELNKNFGNFGTKFGKLIQDVKQLHVQAENKLAKGVIKDLELEERIEKKVQEFKEEIKKRKEKLENAQKKFEDFKNQIESSVGVTHGNKVQNQGKIGLQAWNCAKELGLSSNLTYSNNNSDILSNQFVESILQKIKEELKMLDNKK